MEIVFGDNSIIVLKLASRVYMCFLSTNGVNFCSRGP